MLQTTKPDINFEVAESFLDGTSRASRRLVESFASIQHQKPVDFWSQCVRDTSGRWEGYLSLESKSGFSYFLGRQPEVNYKNDLEVRYILANLQIRSRLYAEFSSILTMNTLDFEEWLVSLHKEMTYKQVFEGNFPRNVPTHTPIVKAEVLSVAERYDDPYWRGVTNGPIFEGIPVDGLPRDVKEGGLIQHYYPNLEYKTVYLQQILKTFHKVITCPFPGGDFYLQNVSYLFQLLINLHLFVNINASLYMNIVNAFLEIADINGIEHGILDFVAMRLQPENFFLYFKAQLNVDHNY